MGRSMLSLSISRRFPLRRRFNKARSLQHLLASQEGLRCDSAELALEIVTEIGDTPKLRFFYDTGADHMVIPVYVARHEGIRFRQDYPGTLSSSVGGNICCYFDFVQVRSSLSGKTHRWVCAFADSVQARLLVGRAGFLNDFATTVTSRHLVVSHAVSVSRFLKHHIARLRGRPRDEWEPI
jgi:hypothetical protein